MKAVKISRARRVESQRSTQTRSMRTKKMLASAKVAKDEGGPGGEGWSCDGDADVGCDEREGADDVGCAEESEEDACGEVAREAEREADDGVDVEAEAGRGDVEDDEHPESEDAPGEEWKHGDAAGRDDEVSARRRSRRWVRWRRGRGWGRG